MKSPKKIESRGQGRWERDHNPERCTSIFPPESYHQNQEMQPKGAPCPHLDSQGSTDPFSGLPSKWRRERWSHFSDLHLFQHSSPLVSVMWDLGCLVVVISVRWHLTGIHSVAGGSQQEKQVC